MNTGVESTSGPVVRDANHLASKKVRTSSILAREASASAAASSANGRLARS